jgi:hypothetical protein
MFGGTGQIDGGTKFNGDISKWDVSKVMFRSKWS